MKIVKISLIVLLIIICLSGVVNAASSCNINLETLKSEYNKGEEFTVDVKISNIKSERGFIALEAVLEYSDSLTLVEMKGQNEWSNPVKDLSYNEATRKLVIDKNGLAKSDEVILKLTFKVNENSKKNLMIALKNIKASDATVSAKVNVAYKNITVKEGTENPIPTPPVDDTTNPIKPVEPEQPETPTINTNTVQTNVIQMPQNTNTTNKENIANGKLPQTGNDNRLLMIFIATAIITGVVIYIKIRIVNKQMGK